MLVFKTSWRRLQDMSWRSLQHMSWRCLQHIFSLTIFHLSHDMSWRHLEDVFKTSHKTFRRRLEDVLKMSLETKNCYAEDVLKTFWIHVLKMSWCWDNKSEVLSNILQKYNKWSVLHLKNIFILKKFSTFANLLMKKPANWFAIAKKWE